MSIETQLREALSSHAASIEPAEAHAYERVTGAVARNRARRRTVGAAAVAVVAAIAIGVPAATSRLGDGPGAATPAGQVKLPAADAPVWDDISTWPTRGALAGDRELVATIDEKFSGRTIFIEDMGAERVAVIANDTGTLVFALGPRGAVADLSSSTSSPITDFGDQVLTVAAGRQLVFLTTPDGDKVEVSRLPEVGLDGTVKRSWAPVQLANGFGRTEWAPLTRFRVGNDAGAADFVGADGGVPFPQERPCTGECSADDRQAMNEDLADLAVSRWFGLEHDAITTTTTYVGEVPTDIASSLLADVPSSLPEKAPKGTPATMQVIFSTLPEGQVLRTVYLTGEGSNPENELNVELANPVPAKSADIQPVILQLASPSSPSNKTTAWVVAPGAAGVQAVSREPELWPSSGRLKLTGGSARLEVPVEQGHFQTQYDLRVFDAIGRVLGTYPVMPPKQEPLQ